jgi:hypothetical protein
MATQTRRTTRHSAKFFRTTVKASMVTACCGLVLLSAVTAQASWHWNGLPFNGLPLNGVPWNGMPFNGIGPNGMPYNGMPIQWLQLQGMPFNGTPIQGLPVNGVSLNGLPTQDVLSTGSVVNAPTLPAGPQERLPWQSLSQRPLGAAAVLSGSDNHRSLPVELPDIR